MQKFNLETYINTLPTTVLVLFYNDNANEPVKKFRDRATAVERVLKLISDERLQITPESLDAWFGKFMKVEQPKKPTGIEAVVAENKNKKIPTPKEVIAKNKAKKKEAPKVEVVVKKEQRKNNHGTEFNGQTYQRIIHFPRPERLQVIRAGTKVEALAKALVKGSTMEEIIEVLSATGKPVDELRAKNWFNYSLNACTGYGVAIKNNKYVILFPKGISKLLPSKLNEEAKELMQQVSKANK